MILKGRLRSFVLRLELAVPTYSRTYANASSYNSSLFFTFALIGLTTMVFHECSWIKDYQEVSSDSRKATTEKEAGQGHEVHVLHVCIQTYLKKTGFWFLFLFWFYFNVKKCLSSTFNFNSSLLSLFDTGLTRGLCIYIFQREICLCFHRKHIENE